MPLQQFLNSLAVSGWNRHIESTIEACVDPQFLSPACVVWIQNYREQDSLILSAVIVSDNADQFRVDINPLSSQIILSKTERRISYWNSRSTAATAGA